MIPESLRYTKSHEWVQDVDGTMVMGITHHAQDELKDIVFVDLPTVGATLTAGEACAVVESVKAAFDIYAPISGTVTAVNDELAAQPQLINDDCYGKGWFCKIEPSNTAEYASLHTAATYGELLQAAA